MEPQMARNNINSNDKPMKLQPQLNLKCNLKNLKLHEVIQNTWNCNLNWTSKQRAPSDLYLSIIKTKSAGTSKGTKLYKFNWKQMKLQPQLNLKCNLNNLHRVQSAQVHCDINGRHDELFAARVCKNNSKRKHMRWQMQSGDTLCELT